jgi:CubicO group peptidase (beta-lactamase class C family)
MRPRLSKLDLLGSATVSTLALLVACSGNDDTVVQAPGEAVEPADDPSLSEAETAELNDYISEALRRYQVPGVAVSIVQGKDVVYQGTFGVRGLDDPQPITVDTRFAIASVTKSMTTLLAATLADEGKLDWDARAMDVMPAFALSDAATTAQIRVRDLLNGTSGIPRFDTPFFVHAFEPTELVSFVGTIPTVAPPGQVFGYSNAVVSVGGYAVTSAAGAAYDDASLRSRYVQLMQERVLTPIGMSSTTFDIDEALSGADHAWPHGYNGDRGAIVQAPIAVEKFVESVTPAGGAWSSLRDLAAYASTQLSGVAPNGRRVVSLENLEETHTEAIAQIPRGEWPTADREGAGYAMGWFTVPNYRGMRALSHDGNTLGFTSEIFLLPDADVGVVVLANRAQANAFYGAVEQYAVETALGLEHRDDALQAEADGQLLGLFQSVGEQSVPVSAELAQPLLGAYDYEVRLDFTDRGLTLTTDFGPVPMSAYADSGLFVRTGALTGMTLAAFDSPTAPTELTLGIPGEGGLSQPFVLRRRGD